MHFFTSDYFLLAQFSPMATPTAREDGEYTLAVWTSAHLGLGGVVLKGTGNPWGCAISDKGSIFICSFFEQPEFEKIVTHYQRQI